MSWLPKPDHPDARVEWSTEQSEELRRLLDLAESIQDRYELMTRRLGTFLAGCGVSVAAIIGFVIWAATRRYETETAWATAGAVSALLGALIAAAAPFLARFRALRQREARALSEVVEVVREVEQVRSEWSPLERAEFRIRLSRFHA